MGIRSRFLTLSIKEQVFIIIFLSTVFSLIVILCLPCSFSYEILKEDYKKKKRYFYNKYKDYIESCFYYQGYSLLKYEEIIKRFLKQAMKYSIREGLFNYKSGFMENYTEQYPVRDLFYNSEDENDINRTDILYYYCFNENKEICAQIKEGLKNLYDSLYSLIFTTELYNRFKLPELNIPIVDKALSVNINNSFMFCFDKNIMIRNINESIDYKQFADDTINRIMEHMEDYTNFKFFLYNQLFEKTRDELDIFSFVSELNNSSPEERKNKVFSFAQTNSGLYSTIQFQHDKSYLLSYNPDTDNYYYFEFYTASQFLMYTLKLLYDELNMNFIPVFPDNNILFLPEICIFFLFSQSNDVFDEKVIDEIMQNIKKGNSTIKDCFYDKNNYQSQKDLIEILEKNESSFLNISNIIYQGLLRAKDKYPLYFMKYSFPSFSTLSNFRTDYLLLDQINFFLFASFKEPIELSDFILAQYKNLFYLIIILTVYIWIICFFVNIFIFYKVIKQITEPIFKLQEAIKNNNIKNESVFKYEYDDTIQELFTTCKELLTRQVDTKSNSKYSGHFNVLDTQNDSLIDKSKYEKNLIINNDLINKLMIEQQNMMDFSDNIDINKKLDDGFEFNIYNQNTKESEKLFEENKNNINQNKENIKIDEDKEEKEAYKSLLKLSDFLYYYRSKNENNIITVKGKTIIDGSKKTDKQQINRDKVKKKSSIISNLEDIEENININMFDDKDIMYMWYMEEKNNKNKSFNYQIDDDYEELFSESNT